MIMLLAKFPPSAPALCPKSKIVLYPREKKQKKRQASRPLPLLLILKITTAILVIHIEILI